jgi:hypothetical protein
LRPILYLVLFPKNLFLKNLYQLLFLKILCQLLFLKILCQQNYFG